MGHKIYSNKQNSIYTFNNTQTKNNSTVDNMKSTIQIFNAIITNSNRMKLNRRIWRLMQQNFGNFLNFFP